MLGPVMMRNSDSPRLRITSFGINVTSSWTSRLGCRASIRIVSPWPRSCMVGLTYGIGALTETWAKLALKLRQELRGVPHGDIEMTDYGAQLLQNRTIRGSYSDYFFD